MRSKSSEAERERMEPQERNERVCGEEPDTMLILMENLGLVLDLDICSCLLSHEPVSGLAPDSLDFKAFFKIT